MFCIFKAKHRTFFPVLRVVKASLAGGNVEILIFLLTIERGFEKKL